MRNASEMIEHYLKQILQQSHDGKIEIQRNDLAERFNCVPSQINYVIGTRFTLEKGYVVESKRGGGGYIRIHRMELHQHGDLVHHLLGTIGSRMDQNTAEGLIYQLVEQNCVTAREAAMMRAVVARETLNLKLPLRDEVRAALVRAMVVSLLSQ